MVKKYIMNNIEKKITQLLREEKLHLKSHLVSHTQNFPWISFSEEIKESPKEFFIYDWLDKGKGVDLLNDDKKLKEELKRKISSFSQSFISGLRFQLTPKICQKEYYDSSNLIIKNQVDFQKLDYNGLIDLIKEVDLARDKKWVCFLPIELFKLTEGKNEHFEVKTNLLQIIVLPLGNNFQIIFAEISSPLLTYRIDDLFCQENWNGIRQNCLFLIARLLYDIAEVKGKLIAVTNARPIKYQVPYLDKCQTCQKDLTSKEEIRGARRIEFSDSSYIFCSKGCIDMHDYHEAIKKGESKEEWLKKKLGERIFNSTGSQGAW